MCSEIAVGDVIRGRFVLEKELGSGGMGTVFKALDRLRQEARDREPYVAVKVLSETFRRQPLSFIALQREAKKAQKLNHPNIVRVYDFDRDGSTIFLLMEYLSGKSLDAIIRSIGSSDPAGLPLRRVLSVIEGVAAALSRLARSAGCGSAGSPNKGLVVGRSGRLKNGPDRVKTLVFMGAAPIKK